LSARANSQARVKIDASGRRVKMNADAIHEVTSGGLLVGAEALGFDGMHHA